MSGSRASAPGLPGGRAGTRFVSLGTKLVLGMLAIVTAASVLVFREIAQRERRHLVEAKVLAASMVTDLFALGLSAPLDFRDTDAAGAELGNLRKNAEVVYAAAWLAGGAAPFVEAPAPPSPADDHAARRLTVRPDRVEVVRPVVDREGKPIGSAVVHLSLAAENAAYAASLERTVGIGVLTGLSLLSLLVLLVRRQILGPLEGLVSAARRVEKGEAGGALAVRSNDEIGRLARAFEAMSEAIFDREARLSAANKSLEELFDNMRQGIVVFGRDGLVTGAASRRASTLFADQGGLERPLEGASVVELLYPQSFDGDPEAGAFREWITLAFRVPLERWDEVVALAPGEAILFAGETEERMLELELRPIAEGGRLSRVMLLATDATERRRLLDAVASQGLEHAREVAALRRQIGGGGQAFVDFLASAGERLAHLAEVASRAGFDPRESRAAEVARHLHTLRGEARVFELAELAAHLDRLEDALVRARTDAPGSPGATPSDAAALRTGLGEAEVLLARARALFVSVSPLGEAALDQATVRRSELGALVDLTAGRDDRVGEVVRRLASRPFGEAASLLAEQAPAWAEAVGKRVQLRVEGREVPVPPALARVLGGVLAHFVRNAIAHGIEAPDERARQGKPPAGLIVLGCTPGAAEAPTITVEDDGRGLPEEEIVARAKALGVYEEGADPASFIVRAGFSTAEQRTEIAGLGVGLDAARADLEAAGYGLAVERAGRPPPAAGGARFVLAPLTRTV